MRRAGSLVPRRTVAIAATVALALVLSSCGSVTTPHPDSASANALPPSPITDKMVRCLTDAGWEVQRSIEGGVQGPVNLPPAQLASYQSAADACADETGWSTPLSDFTDKQRHELYVQEVAEQSCLTELGYPGDEPPSEQTYLDTFASIDQYYAFRAVSDLHKQEFEAAIRSCPPPTWFLNISGF